MSGTHIHFVGDSHLHGVGDPDGLGWTGRVLGLCRRAGLSFTTGTLGDPGDTSAELVTRWTHQAPKKLLEAPDARAVISFGVNDTAAQLDRSRRINERRSLKVLGLFLDEMNVAGIKVFVVGPAPVSDALHQRRLEQLSEAFPAICEERQVPYVSVFDRLLGCDDWFAELEHGDQIHPGARGYQALADLLQEAGLVEWLSRAVAIPQGLPHRRGDDRRAEGGP